MHDHSASLDRNEISLRFERYDDARKYITKELEQLIGDIFKPLLSGISIKARTKDFNSYFKKLQRIKRNDLAEGKSSTITDLIGLRVICPFIDDIGFVEEELNKRFTVTQVEQKGNHTVKEFGYQSTHLLIKIPESILDKYQGVDCSVAEIQIRTILQDAWAEVEHELVYKAEFTPLDLPIRRKLAAVNANLTLADISFQEIRDYQRQLNGELDQRRVSFFRKVEDSTDALIFASESPKGQSPGFDEKAPANPVPRKLPSETLKPIFSGITVRDSMDDLLLKALGCHNVGQYPEAISLYTRILEMNPEQRIFSMVLKHRGMAFFSQSNYQEAIDDFTQALELDPKAYKIFYYRGIIHAVNEDYSAAIDDYNQALEANPYQSYFLYRRGQAYYHLDDYPQALADCEAALALDPSIESMRMFRNILLEKLRM